MNQFTLRAHRRYAHNLPVELCGTDRASATGTSDGLLIEISLESARISQLHANPYQPGDVVMVQTPCGKQREARISWTRAGLAGVKFERALHLQELGDWLASRSLTGAQVQPVHA